MSSRFNGFSQDEIHKIHTKSAGAPMAAAKVDSRLRIKKLPEKHVHNGKTSKPVTPIETIPPMIANNNNNDISTESNDTIQSLQEALHFRPLSALRSGSSVSTDGNQNTYRSDGLNAVNGGGQVSNRNGINGNGLDGVNGNGNDCEDVSDRRSIFQGVSLKDFEQHRKMVEEQNKQKKEMLTKAIEQRFERTAAEAKRIAEVKEELTKLDAELASDVAILRKEIETVSLQYANVQKSYQQVESQFLKAKLELHQSLEKKELLTEHLCTIISHNEDRKAKKLTELMEKVGLSPNGEQYINDLSE